MSKLIMFIGIPGSGKTTLARKYRDTHDPSVRIYEADMFFISEVDGKYHWNPEKLGLAHQWCQNMVKVCMMRNQDVIVSNTNLTPKERAPYLKLAKEFGYNVEVHTCVGEFQNVHDVPPETIKRMKEKFVPYSEDELKKI